MEIYMDFEIIDFHTHPFNHEKNNICNHRAVMSMNADTSYELYKKLGVSKICGAVGSLYKPEDGNYWKKVQDDNNTALELREYYAGFYIPGFHVHPDYIEESINEIKRMHSLGVKLCGELGPYLYGWKSYADENFSCILDELGRHNMIVNFHSSGNDDMDKMVKDHPDIIFVAAHPGEYSDFMRHIERMKMSENYYLDISGYGIFRYGMLKRAVDTFGADRILFGSDYPTCNPGMYIGGVLFDDLLTDSEKEKIFSLNAKKLLGL